MSSKERGAAEKAAKESGVAGLVKALEQIAGWSNDDLAYQGMAEYARDVARAALLQFKEAAE